MGILDFLRGVNDSNLVVSANVSMLDRKSFVDWNQKRYSAEGLVFYQSYYRDWFRDRTQRDPNFIEHKWEWHRALAIMDELRDEEARIGNTQYTYFDQVNDVDELLEIVGEIIPHHRDELSRILQRWGMPGLALATMFDRMSLTLAYYVELWARVVERDPIAAIAFLDSANEFAELYSDLNRNLETTHRYRSSPLPLATAASSKGARLSSEPLTAQEPDVSFAVSFYRLPNGHNTLRWRRTGGSSSRELEDLTLATLTLFEYSLQNEAAVPLYFVGSWLEGVNYCLEKRPIGPLSYHPVQATSFGLRYAFDSRV